MLDLLVRRRRCCSAACATIVSQKMLAVSASVIGVSRWSIVRAARCMLW